jgi:FKBP-type peptidyl-prolyl cis-trans isomerase FklB
VFVLFILPAFFGVQSSVVPVRRIMCTKISTFAAQKVKNEHFMKDISYAIGLSIASNLKNSGVESLDIEYFTKGLKAILNNEEITMSPEETNEILNTYFEGLHKKAESANSESGKVFLAENKSKPGVIELPSGLQYVVLAEGSGAKATAKNQVKVHYTGTLIDGTVFDSSVSRGEPATFGVTQVIAGWVEGLQLMSKGAKYKFFIPSNLAYGAQGAGKVIGPHATLVFEVELLEIM